MLRDTFAAEYRHGEQVFLKREERRRTRKVRRRVCKELVRDPEIWDEGVDFEDRTRWVWLEGGASYNYGIMDQWILAKKHEGVKLDRLRSKLSRAFDSRTRMGAAILRDFDRNVVKPEWCCHESTRLRDDDGVIRRYRREGGRKWADINRWLAGRSIVTSGNKLFWQEEEFSESDYDFQEQLTAQQWEEVLEQYCVDPEPMLREQTVEEEMVQAFDLHRSGCMVVSVLDYNTYKTTLYWGRKQVSRYRSFRGLERSGSTYINLYYRTEYSSSWVADVPLSEYDLRLWNALGWKLQRQFQSGN